ncbi:MAG: hypothetical protein ACJAUC_004331 [Planctomycetota bacterium]
MVGWESIGQECCPDRSIERAPITRDGYVTKVHDLRSLVSVTARSIVSALLCLASLVAQQMRIPMGDPEGLPATASQIERHGITWTFADEHVVGRYANGDPWVLGPVEVIRIEPVTAATAGRTRHGSMINPDPSLPVQGYDSELYGPDTLKRYDPDLNVALGVSSVKPCKLAPQQSLVSVESRASSATAPTLQKAAVLTCVSTLPAPDSFRPPYVKGDKAMPYRAADLDFTTLQTLSPIGDLPLIEAIAERFDRLWLDHVPEWISRYMHPADNMPDYGRDIASLVGSAGLMLNLDYPELRKRRLLISLVQVGIDNHAALRGGCRWQGIGGHGHGRKLPILIAGRVLNDERMLNIGQEFESKTVKQGGKGAWFAEDGQTFYVTETSPGVWNWGHGNYTAEHDGLPEWGFSHSDNPERDDSRWDANPYRRCCTGNAWMGQALTARMMGLRGAWNHDPFFDYVDRYGQVVHEEGWHLSWVNWHPLLWAAYRSNY